MATWPVERLTVVGLGLIGGSVARAAREQGAATRIVAVGRTPGPLAAARAAGVVDQTTTDLAAGVRDADLVVLCAPVGTLPGLIRASWPHLAPGAVLTDVGSVKTAVVAAAAACPARDGVAFVGGHPIAGSERTGFDAAQADLFAGRLTLLTPTAGTPEPAVARVRRFWEALGSQVRVLAPEAHDRSVAAVSHLVHLAAFGLVSAAADDDLGLAGPGFQDTTRVASSAEALWTDIFRGNQAPLLDALAVYQTRLTRWATLIREGQWDTLEAELGQARRRREKLG
jgi:cyclohexadieny/prephenate dehydrogenase